MCVNGKVIERVWPVVKPANYENIKKGAAGKHVELRACKMWYEPKYGVPEKIEDFTAEHKGFIEDMMYQMSFTGDPETRSIHKVVAVLKNPDSKDEENPGVLLI